MSTEDNREKCFITIEELLEVAHRAWFQEYPILSQNHEPTFSPTEEHPNTRS